MSELDALVQIIVSNVAALQANGAQHGRQLPDLRQPFQPALELSLAEDAAAALATQRIVAAASQLIAAVQQPVDMVLECATGMFSTTTLQFTNDNDIADILAVAGPQGASVTEIATQIGVNEGLVARCLRYLSTRHIFQEVRPNVFANNRHSSSLVKGIRLDEINTRSLEKYTAAPLSAVVNFCTEESFMANQKLSEWLKDPRGYPTPFSLSLSDMVNIFDWYKRSDNQWRGRRFSSAMLVWSGRWPSYIFSSALRWNALDHGSIVVDVGGNNGSVAMDIARTAPNLRYVIQDLEPVVDLAKKYWEEEWPEAISAGIVSFQVQDFFEPSNLAADVYILRSIIHDWDDQKARKILENLRNAAKPTSRLVVFEMTALPSCEASTLSSKLKLPDVPYPLLGNLGLGVGGHTTTTDIELMSILDGGERSVENFEELGESSGWKLESVKQGPISAFIYAPIL